MTQYLTSNYDDALNCSRCFSGAYTTWPYVTLIMILVLLKVTDVYMSKIGFTKYIKFDSNYSLK